jgi:Uma2 family endonuclease
MTAETPTLYRWTRAAYDAAADALSDSHAELIDGQIVEIEVTHSPRHASAVRRVTQALARIYGLERVSAQLPLALSDSDEPEPDVMVLPEGWRDTGTAHPTRAVLVVEVADRSLAYDRSTKATRYAAGGVAVYWIVNLLEHTVEVRTQPTPTGYGRLDVYRGADRIPCPGVPAQDVVASVVA